MYDSVYEPATCISMCVVVLVCIYWYVCSISMCVVLENMSPRFSRFVGELLRSKPATCGNLHLNRRSKNSKAFVSVSLELLNSITNSPYAKGPSHFTFSKRNHVFQVQLPLMNTIKCSGTL